MVKDFSREEELRFADNANVCIRNSGLSMAKFSKRIKIGETLIYNIKKGKQRLHRYDAELISQALGLSVEDLLGDTPPEAPREHKVETPYQPPRENKAEHLNWYENPHKGPISVRYCKKCQYYGDLKTPCNYLGITGELKKMPSIEITTVTEGGKPRKKKTCKYFKKGKRLTRPLNVSLRRRREWGE